jgi:hypothetical protein
MSSRQLLLAVIAAAAVPQLSKTPRIEEKLFRRDCSISSGLAAA